MSARPDVRFSEIVELSTLTTNDLDSLFEEEIRVWEERFHWDFRASADLLRRFIQVRSLYGYALVVGNVVVGYTYYVCEGRKGLIGDFFVRQEHATASNEMMLLGATVQGLMLISGIKRIESQLMMLHMPLRQPLPFTRNLTRHDRFFMEVNRSVIVRLQARELQAGISFCPYSDRLSEELAHLVSASYRGHVDSEINDQYRSIPGARHFLTNIVRFPGCGNFSPVASTLAADQRSGRVCGACLASSVSSNSGHVTQLCVLPALRGTRLGYELLRRTLSNMASAGCANVSLTVTTSNLAAIRLYESVGFKTHSSFPALVWEGF
jgi:ribosomal protein S18 acetylase RimI-like enzyme